MGFESLRPTTNSMRHSLSYKSYSSSARREIPRILRSPHCHSCVYNSPTLECNVSPHCHYCVYNSPTIECNVSPHCHYCVYNSPTLECNVSPHCHYCVYNSPTLECKVSSINPDHDCPTEFLKTNFHNILPPMTRSSKWFLSFRFPQLNPVWTFPLPHTCYREIRELKRNNNHINKFSCIYVTENNCGSRTRRFMIFALHQILCRWSEQDEYDWAGRPVIFILLWSPA